MLLGEGVGLALLVVLDTLTPAERLAFVLHDLFAVPFDQIAPIVGRSPGGEPRVVFRFTLRWGRIVEIELLADPERLRRLDLAVLGG